MEVDLDAILKSVEEQVKVDKSMFLSKEEHSDLQRQVDQMSDEYKESLLANDAGSKPKGFVKILLVDDSMVSRKALKAMLKEYKVQFYDAKTGYEAIEALEIVKDFDLITMDYNMPGINGMETFEKIKHHKVPVVMVTTESSKRMVCEALKKGLAHFILKPVRQDDFLKKVTAVLTRFKTPLNKKEETDE